MYRNKREIITLLLAKKLNCNNTVAKHNEIYPHALLFFGCDPASARSLITSAFPLTSLPLPVLIKAKGSCMILYAIFCYFCFKYFMFHFLLLQPKATRHTWKVQNRVCAQQKLMLLLLLETLTSRWLRIWTSHMLSSTPKKKKPNPSNHILFACNYAFFFKYYSVQNLHH